MVELVQGGHDGVETGGPQQGFAKLMRALISSCLLAAAVAQYAYNVEVLTIGPLPVVSWVEGNTVFQQVGWRSPRALPAAPPPLLAADRSMNSPFVLRACRTSIHRKWAPP